MEKLVLRNFLNISIHWSVLFLTLTSFLIYYFTSIDFPTFIAHNISTGNDLSQTIIDHFDTTNSPMNVTKNEPNHKAITNLKTVSSQSLNITKNVTHFHGDTNCLGKYIYMHNLPPEFNTKLVENCDSLLKWFDFCPYLSNKGFGPKVDGKSLKNKNKKRNKSWYKTNQFSLEVIFHEKMKRYKCLTNDSTQALAIFVPYYVGLDLGRFLWGFNVSTRDDMAKRLVHWLGEQHEWQRMLGRDHFLVCGRVSWDFKRVTKEDSAWGSNFMLLPESKNMTILSIERGSSSNEFAIPYPSYFHPSRDDQVLEWQRRLRRNKRPYLFSFVGAPRPDSEDSIRGELIKQCVSSRKLCKFLGCNRGTNCDEPENVMRVFERSVFCLQPPGDSNTRRSTFDSILGGCVPVFFSRDSGYDQYSWHFPRNETKYSVFVSEREVRERRVSVSERLLKVPKREVLRMREEVIGMIPRIVYSDPKSSLVRFEDAFDIAVKNVLERVNHARLVKQER